MVKGASLRIVFFGTPQFAVPTLDALVSSHHSVVAVVTQPDRPRGRGQKLSDAPVKARAMEARVPVLQPHTLKDASFLSALEHMNSDIGVVAAYGKILPEVVIAMPRLGMVNVHASLLPRYRGAAPIHRAVMAGDRETGVTIMRVVKALDAGPMMANSGREILDDETSDEVEHDLARIGASLLVATLDQIAAGTAKETPQVEADATYAHRLTKDDGIIDWSRPAAEIRNQIRGLHPWPHAFSFLKGERVILHRATTLAPGPLTVVAAPGTVLTAHGDELLVATGRGALALNEIQREGKRPTTTREFLAGHAVAEGDRFIAHA
jgi:methionyl-tRNA formyltransferase